MEGIRCINLIREQINNKGMKQVITEFSHKNGTLGTEIVTELDNRGNKGIRTIKKDIFGVPRSFVDQVYGRTEEYVCAYPDYGVYQITDGIRTGYYPNVRIMDLCKY